MFIKREWFLLLDSDILGKSDKVSMQMNYSLDSNGYDKSLYCVEKSQHTGAQQLSKNA